MVSSTLDRLPGPRLLAGCLLLLITTPPALSQGTLDREEVRQVADSLGALRYSIEALAQRVVDAYGVAGEPGAREPDGPYRRAAALYQVAASAHNGLVARISLDLADGAAVTYGRYESPFDSVRSAREALWDHVEGRSAGADSVVVGARSGSVVHGIGSLVRTAWGALVEGAREIRGRTRGVRGAFAAPQPDEEVGDLFRRTYSLPAFEAYAPGDPDGTLEE